MSGREEQDTVVKRSRRRRKGGVAALVTLVTVIAAAAIAALVMVGRPVDAPDWLRDRIESRIAQAVPGLDVRFGRMSLLIQRTGLARFILWDVSIANARGETVAELSDIEAGLSPGALLRGRLELREAEVSGAFVTLQRDKDGRFGLALGDAFSEGTRAPDLNAIIAQVDRAFADPRLARFALFEADALTVRYEDQRAHRGWTADGGRLRLEREGESLRLSGDVALLSGGADVSTVEVNAQSRLGETAMEFGLVLKDLPAADIATQSPALAWLDGLDAPISGALRSGLNNEGLLHKLSATLQIGAGVLQPNSATKALPFDGARTYFSYDPAEALLTFDEIRVRSAQAEVTASGQAQLQGLETGWPEGLTGQFALSGLRLAEGVMLDRDLEVSGARVEFKLSLAPFTLQVGRLRVTDPKFPLRASGALRAARDGWHLALDATAEATDVAQVMSYWPHGFRAQTRNWVTENILEGRLHDIVFALRLAPGTRPETYLDLGFDGGRVTYNRNLPDIREGAGRLTMYDGRLGVRVDAGMIEPGQGGGIDISGSEFVIPDLMTRPAPGEVRLKARGSATAALSYIDNEAWRVLERAGRGPDLATGQAEVTGRLAMDLREGLTLDDIFIDLTGDLRDVASDTLVPGRRLAADRLSLSLTRDRVAVEGAVSVEGVPATGRWTQPLNGAPGAVEASLDITPAGLDALGIALPDGMLFGRGRGQLALDLGDGRAPRFSLTSDLAGLGVAIPQLGWQLPPGAQGRFAISGQLGEPMRIDGLSLSGAGIEAEADLSLTGSGGMDTLTLRRLSLSDWLDVAGRVRARGGGQAPAIEIASGRIDMRKATFGGTGGGDSAGSSSPVALTLDTLQITDSIAIRNFRGNFETGGGLRGRFDGLLGGRAPIDGTVVPRNGGTAFRVTGEDAGDVLKGAGLLRTVQNGTFQLDMEPVAGQSGTYDGTMRIEGPRLRDAPAIGALLDAVSVVGLIDQLNGPGIFFSEVEANFRLTPSRVILTRSSAIGPSMGISLDGYYDLASGNMDMQGVLSPVYFLNGIGQIFSRKGEGLIGFNFNLKGAVSAPRVAVNPLSVFTPGMFRDIFRRPPPQVTQ